MNRFLQNYLRFLGILLIINFLTVNISYATHLRAGEITVKRISATTLTYRVTMTTYTDQINGVAANDSQNEVTIYFGVGNISYKVKRTKKLLINPATVCNVYDTVFTYPAQGTYRIVCGITNRNANTVNLPLPSDQIPFFVQTTLVVNGALGLNHSPVLLNLPLDSAGVGKKFVHNPGAFDADGDSLAYRITTPKRDLGDATGVGEDIIGYRDPSTLGTPPLLNQAGTGPATFTMNAVTGDLIWDAPNLKGQYNVAFFVEEWRKGLDGTYIKIGEVERDMQIIVVQTPNNPPILTLPPNICVEAGNSVNFKVSANDKDANNMLITTVSGAYNLDASGNKTTYIAIQPATFSPLNTTQSNPATGTFSWITNCNHVREQPYDVLFKVVDFPGRFAVQLVDIKTIKITVIPPRLQGLTAIQSTLGTVLSWQKYATCTAPAIQSSKIIIYRKVGCTNFQPTACQTGLPASLGYNEIARVSVNDTTYTDKTAQTGSIYSYRIVASLANADSVANLSVSSNEACLGSTIPTKVPVMTNVTVDKTDATTGQITVKWTRPLNLDTSQVSSPYQYRLLRGTAIDGTDFSQIATFNKLTDTVYVDKNLNTTQNVYRYKIAFDYTDNKVVKNMGETSSASSVWLVAAGASKQVKLSWQANVPWSNENQTHKIYREVRGKVGVFNEIAEITVQASNTFNYLDDGTDRFTADGNNSLTLSIDSTYCYKIETVGAYAKLPQLGLLHNLSQVSCASPVDTARPCPPILLLDVLDCKTIDRKQFCEANFFKNKLTWNPATSVGGQNCRKDIAQYKIYYARYNGDKYQLVASVDNSVLSYLHQRNLQDGFAGCYYITAVNSLGIESAASNIVCKDNCPNIELPNVFTPNGDGKNDIFVPLDCPSPIQQVSFEVYNSSGLKVYESTGTTISWDGKTTGGTELPAGTYYYVAKIQFVMLDKNSAITTVKGWIQLIK